MTVRLEDRRDMGPTVTNGSTRVLHLVESLGGGVVTSVLTMVAATPEVEHHLALWPRRSHAHTGDSLDGFESVHVLPEHPAVALVTLHRLLGRLQPFRLHAHSTYAGVLARVADGGAEVVYSPHCFAFERRDLPAVGRGLVRLVERSLARRTGVLAACSPHEADLARDLGHRQVVTVPNRTLDPPQVRVGYSPDLLVATVGRVGEQKDWRHLVAVKQYLEEVLGCRARWEWLGGGDASGEEALREHGVVVTGWRPRSEVVRRLARAQVYVHTAAWEGAPVSILEAAALGLPIAARRIDTLASLGVPGLTGTTADLAARILDLHDPALWASEQQRSLRFAATATAAQQRDRLHLAYTGSTTPARGATAEPALR